MTDKVLACENKRRTALAERSPSTNTVELGRQTRREAGIQCHGWQASSYPCELESGNPCRNEAMGLDSTTLSPRTGWSRLRQASDSDTVSDFVLNNDNN